MDKKRRLVLDIGCGTYCRGDVGIDIQFWYKHPLDQPEKFDPIMGPRNPLCDRIMSDLDYGIPLRDSCVDVIVARAVLEHLKCPYYVLKECKRVLKPGGIIKIVVPNARVSWADWRDSGHLYSWTEASIRNLVSRFFKIVKLQLLFNGESIYIEAVKEDGA